MTNGAFICPKSFQERKSLRLAPSQENAFSDETPCSLVEICDIS